MRHIRTIIDKEWAEVFRTRMVIFTVGFMPLIFTILPLVMLSVMGGAVGDMNGSTADVEAFLANAAAGSGECMQIYNRPVYADVNDDAVIIDHDCGLALWAKRPQPGAFVGYANYYVELLAGKSLAAASRRL